MQDSTLLIHKYTIIYLRSLKVEIYRSNVAVLPFPLEQQIRGFLETLETRDLGCRTLEHIETRGDGRWGAVHWNLEHRNIGNKGGRRWGAGLSGEADAGSGRYEGDSLQLDAYIVTLTIRALASTCGAPTCWCALGHISATPGWRRVDLVLFGGRGSSFSQTWTYTCFPAPAFSGCLSPLSERCKCFPALVKTHRPVHAVYLFGNVTAVFP